MCPVVNFRAVTQRGDIALYRLWQSKELQRLVNQVRPQIKPQTTTGHVLLSPAHAHFRAETVNVRLKVFDLAKGSLLNNLLNAEEVAVPAAVMEDGEQQLLLLRQGNQVAGFLHVECERFVHDHVFA